MESSTEQQITVLHIDDEPDFANLTAEFLTRRNNRFNITTATSADAGLERIAENQIDCVVSDYDMPVQNGIEVLQAVRKKDADLPFILFTGKGSEEVASEAISAGVTDYLQKEAGTEQYAVLANRIENAVEKYRAEQLVNRAFQAMDRSREGIALLDEDGEFIYVNDAYTDIVGYDRAELIGEFWETVYPDDQVDRIHNEILPVIPQMGHWTGETVYQRKGGRRVLVDHALTYSEEGTMICLIRNVTDFDGQTRALREARQSFELFIDAVEDYAIFMLDPGGYITSWNNGAERLKGYAADEILGDHFSAFYTDKQRQEGLPAQLLTEAREEGSVEHKGPRVRQDGTTFEAHVVITAVYDEDNVLRGFGKVTRDMSSAED